MISLISWNTNFAVGSKPELWVDHKECAFLPLFILSLKLANPISSWATTPKDYGQDMLLLLLLFWCQRYHCLPDSFNMLA